MKVLVFTTLFPNNVWPNHGIFVKERMSAVARMEGCEVRVIAPVPYHPPIRLGKRWDHSQVAREEVIDEIHVYHPRYLVIPKISMSFHGLFMFLSVLYFVKKIQTQFDFDIIDAHYVYPDGYAAVLLGRFFRKPVVLTARGSDINATVHLRTIRPLLKFTLQSAKHIVAVSGALRQAITNLGTPEVKISLIPNGVDPLKFKRIPQTEARKALNLPVKDKILLSVGGLNPVKGFDLLIRAFKIFLDQQSQRQYSLLIVGEGPMRKKLEELISYLDLLSHVRLIGVVPHSELYRWYSASNVFCLASQREGRPNVVLEALSCGIPVVATAVGGIPEIIDSQNLGLLAERSEQSIADNLAEALIRNWDAEAIISVARCHGWQATAEKVTRLFESILNASVAEGAS